MTALLPMLVVSWWPADRPVQRPWASGDGSTSDGNATATRPGSESTPSAIDSPRIRPHTTRATEAGSLGERKYSARSFDNEFIEAEGQLFSDDTHSKHIFDHEGLGRRLTAPTGNLTMADYFVGVRPGQAHRPDCSHSHALDRLAVNAIDWPARDDHPAVITLYRWECRALKRYKLGTPYLLNRGRCVADL